MTHRARPILVATALLAAGAVSACGGGGAPADASEKDFCAAANSLVEGLIPQGASDLPSDEEMATAVQDWGSRMEEVGTPEDISDEARRGFEAVVAQAQDITADDFSMDKLQELEAGGADASEDEQAQAEAFGQYLTDTCGNPADDLELPDLGGSDG